jgi:hypothetical protein
MSNNYLKLKPRTRRWLEGTFYLGCYTPVAFAAIALMIIVKAITDRIRPHA